MIVSKYMPALDIYYTLALEITFVTYINLVIRKPKFAWLKSTCMQKCMITVWLEVGICMPALDIFKPFL